MNLGNSTVIGEELFSRCCSQFDLLYKKLPKDLYFQEGLDEQDLLEARITLYELASSYSDI